MNKTTSPALVSVHTFPFLGEATDCFYLDNNRMTVAVTHLCALVGIVNATEQINQMMEDEVYEGFLYEQGVPTKYRDGTRNRKMLLLDSKRVPYWLGRIDRNRIAKGDEEKRKRILYVQSMFADTLDAVHRSILVPPDVQAEIDSRDNLSSSQKGAYEVGDILNRIITEVLQSQNIGEHLSSQMESILAMIEEISRRMNRLANELSARRKISPEQCKKIKDIVDRMVAIYCRVHKNADRPARYRYMWKAIQDHMHVPSYEDIPADNYSKAIRFLEAMWQSDFPDMEPPEGLFTEDPTQPDLY